MNIHAASYTRAIYWLLQSLDNTNEQESNKHLKLQTVQIANVAWGLLS